MSGITTTTTTTTTTTNSNTTTNEIDIDISKMDDCNNDTEEQGEQQQQQQQQQQHGDDDGNTSTNIELPKCYPKWKGKPIYDGNPEVLGWTLVSVAESIQYVGSGAFFATTMLRVARDAMTCHEQLAATSSSPLDSNAAVELCGPTFGSINPSSLLSMYAIVVGLVSTAFLPLLGAIVDYTKHRRLIGRVSSTLFVLFQIPTIFLNEKNYPIVLSFHGCAMLIGWIQMSMLFAYLPELTSCEIKLASYTRSITIWTFSGMIIYLVTVVAFVNIIGKGGDDVFTSMVGMATAFGINVIFFSLAWGFLLGKRGPLHERPVTTTTRVVVTSVEDEEAAAAGTEEEVTVTTSKSLYVIGFTQLWGTAKHIVRNYRSLKWFYVSIAFSESAASAFSVIAITYMTNVLRLTATQNGLAVCVWLLGSIPGAFLSAIVARRLDPMKSSIVYILLIIINILLFSFLTGPGKLITTYVILFLCGISGGWKTNMDRLVSSSIIPTGQHGEMMGFYLFAGQCLSWLPLLVFTSMNEAGIKFNISMVTLTVYLVIALIAYLLIGSYPNARKEVDRTTVYGRNSSNVDGDDDDGNNNDGMTMTPASIDADTVTKELSLDEADEGKKENSKKEEFRGSQRTATTTVEDDISERL